MAVRPTTRIWDVDPVFVRESHQSPVDIGALREDICWEGANACCSTSSQSWSAGSKIACRRAATSKAALILAFGSSLTNPPVVASRRQSSIRCGNGSAGLRRRHAHQARGPKSAQEPCEALMTTILRHTELRKCIQYCSKPSWLLRPFQPPKRRANSARLPPSLTKYGPWTAFCGLRNRPLHGGEDY